jgi:HlyD family secretion protein
MRHHPRGFLRSALLGVLVLGVLALGGFAAWQWLFGGNGGPHFKTEAATVGNLKATISSTGTIEPEEVIDIGAQVAGRVMEFGVSPVDKTKLVDYGTPVEKDTVLALLDDAPYQATLARATASVAMARAQLAQNKATLAKTRANLKLQEADYRQKEAEWRRVQSLKSIAISDSDRDVARAAAETSAASVEQNKAAVAEADAAVHVAEKAIDQAVADQKLAETNVGYCTIKSPVKGVIVDRRVNVGQTVVASLNAPSLFLLAKDLHRLQVWASVNEADIGNIKVGQTATFTVDTYPHEVFVGKVTKVRLNATMTQNVVTYTVEVTTDNPADSDHPDGKLLPYMTATLQFTVNEKSNVLMVPNAALRYRPRLDIINPADRDTYHQGTKPKKPDDAAPTTPAAAKAERKQASLGWVFVEDNGFAKPIRVRTGLSDGKNTEVIEVLDGGELKPDTPLITAEVTGRTAGGSINPFAPKPIFGKKKE